MTSIRPLALAIFASFISANANAQTIQGKFSGTYVCEKPSTTRSILRAPLDLEIKGETVRFARPIFNLDGSRVVGSELADGVIDANGRLQLTSQWTFLGNISNAEYSGTLTPTGGTLTGTQTWTGPDGGEPIRRACTIAVVHTAAKLSQPSQ